MTLFRTPPGDDPIRIALDTGHITWLGHDWQELEPRFHREALKLGAETQAAANKVVPLDAPVDKDEAGALRDALKTMLSRDVPDDFTAAGLPDLRVVRGLVGFNATKEAVYAAFNALKAEAGEQA